MITVHQLQALRQSNPELYNALEKLADYAAETLPPSVPQTRRPFERLYDDMHHRLAGLELTENEGEILIQIIRLRVRKT